MRNTVVRQTYTGALPSDTGVKPAVSSAMGVVSTEEPQPIYQPMFLKLSSKTQPLTCGNSIVNPLAMSCTGCGKDLGKFSI